MPVYLNGGRLVSRSYLAACMVISGLDRLPPCNLVVESVVSFRPGLPSGQPQTPTCSLDIRFLHGPHEAVSLRICTCVSTSACLSRGAAGRRLLATCSSCLGFRGRLRPTILPLGCLVCGATTDDSRLWVRARRRRCAPTVIPVLKIGFIVSTACWSTVGIRLYS
jgi:hypothetical protein